MKFCMKSLPNARDLGGIPTQDGRKIKFGRIIRSSNLALLDGEDCAYLEKYGLKKVVDFRTEAEIAASPDAVINGVTYIKSPILKDLTVGITRKDDLKKRNAEEIILDIAVSMGSGAREWMANLYTPLISGDFSLNGYRRFFDVLKDNKEGAVLYHCTVGKDRVGVGTALFLMAVGVPREEIVKDYMRTNDSVNKLTLGAMELGRKCGIDNAIIENIPYVNGVDESYLEKVYDYIDSEYGSAGKFFEKRMGIGKEYINELKENYTEE